MWADTASSGKRSSMESTRMLVKTPASCGTSKSLACRSRGSMTATLPFRSTPAKSLQSYRHPRTPLPKRRDTKRAKRAARVAGDSADLVN